MHEPIIKLVLDTNTIISGMLWKGQEFLLLEDIERGNAQLFLTREMLQEIATVLKYPRLANAIQRVGLSVEELLEKIVLLAHIVVGKTEPVTVCRDPDDNKLIECAILAGASCIVTGDTDLLVLQQYKKIRIVTTRDALKLLD